MKYIFLVFFSTLIFGETYLTFQRNSTALVQNGFETIEAEATATNQAAYYPLYGNALDYSQNNNDGTVYGAVSTGTNYYFDGVDDYIDIGDINTNSESVSLWFYNDNTISKSSSPECVIQLGINDANNYYQISFGTSTSLLANELIAVIVKDNGDQYRSGYTSSTATITTGWHHLAVVRSDNSENYYIYLDGVKVNNAAVGTDCPAQLANDVRIAQRDNVDYFNGYIKDVRIYNRALTAEEISNIYNATK